MRWQFTMLTSAMHHAGVHVLPYKERFMHMFDRLFALPSQASHQPAQTLLCNAFWQEARQQRVPSSWLPRTEAQGMPEGGLVFWTSL